MEIIFGPVNSRRFGRSLGVDLSPSMKQCNFDCVYCELQGAKSMDSMRDIVPVSEILEALEKALKIHKCDVITLTANGEPTLYPFLEELISSIRLIMPDSVKLLLLTNGSLLWRDEIRKALVGLDIVKFSCDSLEEKSFKRIDRPHSSLSLADIKDGIKKFCAGFKGEIVAEVLFVKNINDSVSQAQEIANFLATLPIHRIDIGSIDRPPAYKVEAVSEETLHSLAQCFYIYPHLNVNLPKRLQTASIQDKKQYTKTEILNLLKRRPLSVEDAHSMFNYETLALLSQLCQKGIVNKCSMGANTFYKIKK